MEITDNSIRIFGANMCILMHFSLFDWNWFLMNFFFFDSAIHRQDHLFTFFSNDQGQQICRKESRTKENVKFFILPIFITFSVVIYVCKNKSILVKSNYCFDQLVNEDYTTTWVTQLSNTFTVITRCNYSDSWHAVLSLWCNSGFDCQLNCCIEHL